ncbi:thiamine/thiamine pyrophosphate ABC transporter permease ThiP [Acidimangrovimonas sediminis]|uniref:thiamine/thiamine pyrophosphate ABC transporter permease ThiP n=1 Tax=Acidimangrovimonas sediminis TaxID=2056283 RepID=UPI000C8053A2|nr:thiamine/thiamine pyrophosphate ABC transporter permease ThiP [Acidimangrovimonas sediminis]
MARRAEQVGGPPGRVLGGAVALGLAALILGTLGAVAWRAAWGAQADGAGGPLLGPADWAALRFTLVQAGASALISVALAVPVARALARRRFPGRRALIALMGAPFILPVIVAVLGLLSVFGRGGIVNAALAALGLPAFSIYGLQGVLIGNVFFNLPLATRLILQGWQAIPAERFRLAAALDFSSAEVAKQIEWPMLREVAPGAALAIFLICLTSFPIALTLGGGPRSTTLELAIYQAFRFDFDLGRAAVLAALQFAVSGVAALIALRLALPQASAAGLDRAVERWDARSPLLRTLDTATIALAALFLILPLAVILAQGLPTLTHLPGIVWTSALTSLCVALGSAVIAAGAALALALAITGSRRPRLFEGAGMLPLAASPLVLGTGLFLIVNPWIDPAALALPVTALVNALLALPFGLRALVPALREIEAAHGRLADALSLTGFARLRLLILPRLRGPMGFTLGLSAALSMGDLGVITLFAAPGEGTLPLQLYRLMGAYRMNEAAGAALLLLVLSFGLFWLFDRGGRADADA